MTSLRSAKTSSENNSFIIKLHHKSVYSSEQKIWLEEFKDDSLSLNEKSVILLGYGGNRFSADDIWNIVGIVDTEDYRKLVYSLQTKGVLASTMGNAGALRAAARKARVPFKKYKRYYIIKPEQRGQPRAEINKGVESSVSKELVAHKVYVTNIPYEIKEDDLYELFSVVGNIEDIFIPYNRETMRPRGFAFVAFETENEAGKAIAKFDGSFLGNRRIAVSLAYKDEKNIQR